MDISKLDEYQGLEAQMVRDWMTRKGCFVLNGYWRHPTEKYTYPDGKYGGLLWANTLNLLSVDFGFGSVQALLREINPRMRNGVPSAAAIVAHEASGGHWLAKSAQNGGVLRVLRWSTTDAAAKLDALDASQCLHRDSVPPSWHFWPCDAHGNKVRWPTDAEGQML